MLEDDHIPFLDLKKQHQQIKTEVFEAIEKVYDSASFANNHFIDEFENRFADYCKAKYAIAVNSGSSALYLALLAAGIQAGDEVIVPANTFMATPLSVSFIGAIPVFVDCTPDTWQIDPSQIASKITSKTKAIIGVHLYGQPFDIDAIQQIANKYQLILIEDAAQAHGATYKNKQIGSISDMTCFSFYPAKNLGAIGEGGGITTNNSEYAERLKLLRNYGSNTKYIHQSFGLNMRMGAIEAVSLNVKLKYLDRWNQQRQQIADYYHQHINSHKIKLQKQLANRNSVYHLLVGKVTNQQAFIKKLQNKHIHVGIHYPIPCHLQKTYKHLKYDHGDFPNTESLAQHCISLPIFPELPLKQLAFIVNTINY